MSRQKTFALSLDLVNLDHQEPNRNRYESKYYWDELFTLIPAAGFTAIELPYQPKWDFGGRSGVPLTQYAIKTKYGTVSNFLSSLHNNGIERIAGVYFNPSLFISSNLAAYFGAFGHFASQAVEFAGEAGAKVLTLTPTPATGMLHYHLAGSNDWDQIKSDFLKRTAELISHLAAQAAACGVTIAVKQEYWSLLRESSADEFFKMISGHVLRNIDTAHSVITGLDPLSQIRTSAGKIGSVHFTDTAFTDNNEVWREVNPEYPTSQATQIYRDIGQGQIDFAAIYKTLQENNYNGDIICSCRQTRDPMRAMLRTRRYLDRVLLSTKGGAAQ